MIEEVLIKRTLKAGNKIWEEGVHLRAPLPKVIIEEAMLRTGTVEIIRKSGPKAPDDKLIFVAQRVDEKKKDPENTTNTAMQSVVPPQPPPVKSKPKPKVEKPEPKPEEETKPKPVKVLKRRRKR